MAAARCWLRVVALAALVVSSGAAAQSSSKDAFVTVNGVRLHYADWGGNGPVLLFLTSLRSSVREFDTLAPKFVDRFHVLGLTRRGKDPSDKPPSGYDTTTLAGDIKGFLDFRREMKHGRVVELRDTNHVRFLVDPAPQAIVVREMREFLLEK